MNRWVTVLGLIIALSGAVASVLPETSPWAAVATAIGAVAAAIGRSLWPEDFPDRPDRRIQ